MPNAFRASARSRCGLISVVTAVPSSKATASSTGRGRDIRPSSPPSASRWRSSAARRNPEPKCAETVQCAGLSSNPSAAQAVSGPDRPAMRTGSAPHRVGPSKTFRRSGPPPGARASALPPAGNSSAWRKSSVRTSPSVTLATGATLLALGAQGMGCPQTAGTDRRAQRAPTATKRAKKRNPRTLADIAPRPVPRTARQLTWITTLPRA